MPDPLMFVAETVLAPELLGMVVAFPPPPLAVALPPPPPHAASATAAAIRMSGIKSFFIEDLLVGGMRFSLRQLRRRLGGIPSPPVRAVR